MIMLTKWQYSIDTEAERLIQCSHQVAVGFYRINGFIVLPQTMDQNNQTVAFPDINYLSIPRFWDRCRKIDIGTKLPYSIPYNFSRQLTILLESNHLQEIDFSRLKVLWSRYETRIIKSIESLIPSKRGWIKKILIYPTSFGTITSFNYLNKPGTVHMWLRSDAGISNIVEAILTSITRNDVYHHLNFTWTESEAVIDWLLAYSPLSGILQKIDPGIENSFTLKSTRNNQRATIMDISRKFLNKIGAPATDASVVKKVDLSNFTDREKQLYEHLVNRSPSLVTIDEIADLLFPNNPEGFSLYAIAKSIQRLRDKLEQNGISGSFIQTKRGEGYLLAN